MFGVSIKSGTIHGNTSDGFHINNHLRCEGLSVDLKTKEDGYRNDAAE